jgi:hypothetical protein
MTGHRRRADSNVAAAGSRSGPVAEVDDAVAEAAFVQQLQVQPEVVGEGSGAASDHDRREEELALVDETGRERVACQLGAADGEVPFGRRLQAPRRVGVEGSLDPGPRARDRSLTACELPGAVP